MLASIVSVLIFARAMTRTCLGFALTTFLTCGAITAATEAALPVASTTTTSSFESFFAKSLEKRPAHVNAPQSLELAVVPGHRLGEGGVDIQTNDPHGCSSVSVRSRRELAGNTAHPGKSQGAAM